MAPDRKPIRHSRKPKPRLTQEGRESWNVYYVRLTLELKEPSLPVPRPVLLLLQKAAFLSHSDICTKTFLSFVTEWKRYGNKHLVYTQHGYTSIMTLFREVEDTTDYKDSSHFQGCSYVGEKTPNNHFQTLLNENYILISEMLKCEEGK